MDGDEHIKTDGVLIVDAPDLGALVELREGTVGDALALMDAAPTLPRFEFLLMTLAVSLRIDGRSFTLAELKNLPGRKLAALLRIAPQAVELNQFFPAATDEGEDAEPKS